LKHFFEISITDYLSLQELTKDVDEQRSYI